MSYFECLQSNQWFGLLVPVQKIVSFVFLFGVSKILGPILLSTALVLILGVTYIFFVFLLPTISSGSSLSYAVHFLCGVYLATNILFNLVSCAFTAAGSPKRCRDPGKILGQKVIVVESKTMHQIKRETVIYPGVSYKLCRHCRCVKPPRAHHDSITGKCVYEMDHFCPWMNNCIGYYNYKYFVLFMAYLFVGCVYILVVCSSWVLELTPAQRRQALYGGIDVDEAVILTFTVALSAALAVGILLGWHIYLILTNQTTIEFYINYENRSAARSSGILYKNPFDLGWRKNIKRVFGNSPWYYCLFPSSNIPLEPMYPLQLEPGVLESENFVV
mmetsp:Transcript_16849/g.25340  ORF Transcript_16849/g.25340 Transcript_16849/m.25340 type:complete len:331 (-) Transcript_16849:55-1047(-)